MNDLHPDRDRAEEITAILNELGRQEGGITDQFVPLVYDELKKIARSKLRFERKGHTLNTTALVHEAYVKLSKQDQTQWQSRVHFMAVASTVMRRVLINYAESRNAQKRGGGNADLNIDDIPIAIDEERADEILSLDEALKKLADFDKQGAQMIEYRFFGGLSQKEIAEVMGISERTVRRQWVVAKSWIKREIETSE